MISADDLIAATTPIVGYTPTREQIAVAMLDIDQAAIAAASAARHRWEIWDKTSPINNVPAEQVIAHRDDYMGGEVYLMYTDDALVVFQPFNPQDGTPMSADEVEEFAAAEVARSADASTWHTVVQAAVAALPRQQMQTTTFPSTVSTDGTVTPGRTVVQVHGNG